MRHRTALRERSDPGVQGNRRYDRVADRGHACPFRLQSCLTTRACTLIALPLLWTTARRGRPAFNGQHQVSQSTPKTYPCPREPEELSHDSILDMVSSDDVVQMHTMPLSLKSKAEELVRAGEG